jgi:dTDP-4-dehydrorhamnose 3,5-epimerase
LNFRSTALDGVCLVSLEPRRDERGFFARTWCAAEFERAGLEARIVQMSLSRNPRAGTLRGLHYTLPSSREAKLIRCSRGRVLDVALDLRRGSPSYLQHVAVELDADSGDALYVPPGVAHGFQTLVDDTDVSYAMTEAYREELTRGVRYDDASFGITWPLAVSAIHERDRRYPDWDPS